MQKIMCLVKEASFKIFLYTFIVTTSVLSQDTQTNSCQVPSHPKNGIYTITGEADPNAEGWISLSVAIRCNPGYTVFGKSMVTCRTGIWTDELPLCSRTCKLSKHPSVDYFCVTEDGTRLCEDFELGGTTVKPVCKKPDYYYNGFLPAMHCVNGNWDYLAVCLPACGTLPLESDNTIDTVQAPWHVGIYTKSTWVSPYQICGGTIISNSIVVSAANCFWVPVKEVPSSPSSYSVAAGKLYRSWSDSRDTFMQRRDVFDIKLPPTFQGKPANLIDDIALVYVTEPFEYNLYVKPVCADFDSDFDDGHLQPGNLAKVPFWDREPVSGQGPALKAAFIPFVNTDECTIRAGSGAAAVTSDKFCLGDPKGVKFCERNIGTGVVYPERDRGLTRYFLRGVVSSVVKGDDSCKATVLAVTRLQTHENFIRLFV